MICVKLSETGEFSGDNYGDKPILWGEVGKILEFVKSHSALKP